MDILYVLAVYLIMLDDGRYRTCARVFTATFCWKKARKKVLISPTIMNTPSEAPNLYVLVLDAQKEGIACEGDSENIQGNSIFLLSNFFPYLHSFLYSKVYNFICCFICRFCPNFCHSIIGENRCIFLIEELLNA